MNLPWTAHESRRRMRGKTRLTSLEQPSAPTANTSPDTTQQQTKEEHDDKRRRTETTVPTAAQDEVLVPCGENSQGWITEEAFSTVSHGARQVRQRKENQLSPAERNEFLMSMEFE